MLNRSIQVLGIVFGGLLMLGGLASAASGIDPGGGIWAVVFGAAVVVVAVLQRSRYRSLAAERTDQGPGPGGGEDGFIEPRFSPTAEMFVDPTSGRIMRVFVDPSTGERRYRAEG